MKAKSHFLIILFALMAVATLFASNNVNPKVYKLWYDKPVPELPIKSMDSLNTVSLIEATPFDPAWENWSLPIGNGYLGASIFGRTTTERIQITENSMASKSLYGGVGLTNFAELYLDFGHKNPQKYQRSLLLNNAMSTVSYEQDGVRYEREYFASYPDKVLVIRLKANSKGKISFTLRPEIPNKHLFGAASGNYGGRDGKVSATNGLVTLAGKIEVLNLMYEGQFKVIPEGGKMTSNQDINGDNGTITVTNANSVVIIVAVGTNYKLESKVFDIDDRLKKLEGNPPPHDKVSAFIAAASAKSYDNLLAAHEKDYKNLFDRATINFGGVPSELTTDVLLANYKNGKFNNYLDELYFNYGRYMLICSSRPGTLPPNLQGIWNQYEIAPWTGGYWHNINIQMNYWPVFNTNLTELFQSFVDYNLAYRKKSTQIATNYIKKFNPSSLENDNGWTIGTGACAYNISAPGGHSGPGTGAMTTKMFWDYYEFTGNKKILNDLSYPAILGMAKFLSKAVIEKDGFLLADPSYSPEQRSKKDKLHYQTVGSAFDQQMIYENHLDALKAAKILGEKNATIGVLESQLNKLDPVQIGWSGQIKEYREEKHYGDLELDPKHRHTSQLMGLCPGTIINSLTPAWLDAARESLDRRGDQATGWGIALRMNMWARIKDGDRTHKVFERLLTTRTLDNLWNKEPPFTIEGNFGATAAIAEMLVQSHEGFIDLLPALPQIWSTGSFNGLLARGNFEVSAQWENNQAKSFIIKSKIGGICKLRYPNLKKAVIKNSAGQKVKNVSKQDGFVEFNTLQGEVFTISAIPASKKVSPPTNLVIKECSGEKVSVQWNSSLDAASYNVYSHFGDSPDYKLIKSYITTTGFDVEMSGLKQQKFGILRVTAVDKMGRESIGARVNIEYK